MGNMANNDYHKIAEEILKSGAGNGDAAEANSEQAPAIDQVQEMMRKEGIEGEGSDAWHAEAVQRAVELLDPSIVATLPIEEIATQLGLNVEPEAAQQIDSIQNPEERLNAIMEYASSMDMVAEQGPVEDEEYDHREDEEIE